MTDTEPDIAEFRSAQRLERLISVGRSLLTQLEPEELLQQLLEEARALTGARYAAIGVLDESRRELERFVTAGIDHATHERIGALPRGRGVLGVLISEPQPLRLTDVGSHPSSYGFPIGHPPMASFLGVPVLIRGEAWGNIYLAEKVGGEPFSDEDQSSLVVLADWAAIAIDNARAYAGERDRRQGMEAANVALRATEEITRALGGETDLTRILELIAKRGRALLSARALFIALLDGEDAVVAAAAGSVPSTLVGERLALDGSPAAEVVRTGRPTRLAGQLGGLRSPVVQQLEADYGLVVPLTFRGRVLGILAAFDHLEGDPDFSADDERLIGAFAASAATAVATGQHVAEEGARRSLDASEQERSRWARELHDDTLQELAALRLTVSGARRLEDLDAVRATLEEVRDGLASSIDGLRSLITDLRPAALDELGTIAAIETLVERVASRSGVDVHVAADLDYESGRAPTRYVPELEAAIYRLVQEALTNATKHAGATQVQITLREGAEHVDLEVRDDGLGFDVDAATEGFGVIGMQERAELMGGALAIASAAGEGTVVSARLPVRRLGASGVLEALAR
jgi:signal transduction histidine kinase